jgi:hypothetical protein
MRKKKTQWQVADTDNEAAMAKYPPTEDETNIR